MCCVDKQPEAVVRIEDIFCVESSVLKLLLCEQVLSNSDTEVL